MSINFCKKNYSHDHCFISIGVEIGQLPDDNGMHSFYIVCAYCGQVRAINEKYDIRVIKESGNVPADEK